MLDARCKQREASRGSAAARSVTAPRWFPRAEVGARAQLQRCRRSAQDRSSAPDRWPPHAVPGPLIRLIALPCPGAALLPYHHHHLALSAAMSLLRSSLLPLSRAASSAACARARALSTSAVRARITPLVMPAMSPTMTEGGIARWALGPGDAFSAGDVILEIVSFAGDRGGWGQACMAHNCAAMPKRHCRKARTSLPHAAPQATRT
jgi:hypothetical protein